MKACDRVGWPAARYARLLRGAFLLILFTPWVFIAQSHAEDASRRVLVLHAYNYTFPATALVSDAVRKRWLERSPEGLEIDAEYLDLARRPDEAHASRMANFLREKYVGVHFDLLFVIGVSAIPFILKYRDVIGPGVPVVFSDVTRSTYEALQLPSDITGVINNSYPEKTLELAERLQPNARRLVVISGTDVVDLRWREIARTAIESQNAGLEVVYWSNLTHAELLRDVSRLPSDSIVMMLTFFADREGKRFIPRDVAAAVAKASAAPVYGIFDTYIGAGIVGGYTDTFESLGITAADMALEILSGTEVTKVPPRSNPKPAFRTDARAMTQWGLKESDLPLGSVVLFKQPTLWSEHRYLVLSTILIVGLQASFVAALLFQRRRRYQAEISLKESEERMSFTAASVNVGLWQFDRTTNGMWATEHCRAMFGLAGDRPLTRDTFLEIIHPDDRDVALAAIRQITNAGEPAVTQVRILMEGQVRWISIRTRVRPDDHGAPNRFSGIFVDVTEQKASESEAELQRQEVTHLMRVSVLGELSGAIAHEVNQPLTAILSNAQAALYLLADDPPNIAEVRDALQDIVQDVNRAGEVIHRLRSLLKKGETVLESVSMNALIDETVALLRSEMIDRRIMVNMDLAAALPQLFGDAVQLQQVLLNILVNAMDAMASTAGTRTITISSRATQGCIEVFVRDRGPGIEVAQADRLFEPFFTTKTHGLGLGLTICSTIIEAHGGKIAVANDRTGGVVATILLPTQEVLAEAQ
ncbi:PAS domain-containing protein [Bradyrhizobium sp. 38]|uniref:sensor histidine kinase n=1 Tax=unclassified Bradyrhizobium TaxID=2631580 RepID=UPI001FF7BF97|nr:PAS domain-containing protein [Bradyrhizobium sp. 38]MCK1779391.1 PAS domain-containing protein [Bradyrhizobium sp. 132]